MIWRIFSVYSFLISTNFTNMSLVMCEISFLRSESCDVFSFRMDKMRALAAFCRVALAFFWVMFRISMRTNTHVSKSKVGLEWKKCQISLLHTFNV